MTAVTKAISDLSETVTKALEAMASGQKELTDRVEGIEKARQPSKANNDEDVPAEKVEKQKSLWGGVL